MPKCLILDRGTYYLDHGGPVPCPGGFGLLNGKGGLLPSGANPVFLEIDEADLLASRAHNSAGEMFVGNDPVGVIANTAADEAIIREVK